ncbi:cytochrome P450 [Xylaria venustula]|nr:cytochrome P450 [Xylaria venustula]
MPLAALFLQFIKEKDEALLDPLALCGDALNLIVAGSHSTAAALTMLFYELVQRPLIQSKLREGLLSARNSPKGPEQEDNADYDLPYLDACIEEILRLYPTVLTGGIRQTVDKGFMIGGQWIPPNTVIVAPRRSISRLESAFGQPLEFIPERWTTRGEMVKDRRASSPFAHGRHTCPGKRLGLLEFRIITAMIITRFKFSIAGNKTRVVGDLQDAFTASPGHLLLNFTPIY